LGGEAIQGLRWEERVNCFLADFLFYDEMFYRGKGGEGDIIASRAHVHTKKRRRKGDLFLAWTLEKP
jgi:hypothetical protein